MSTQSILTASMILTLTAVSALPALSAGGQEVLPLGARVAVFAHSSIGESQVDRVVGDMMTTALRKAGVRVIERQDLDAIAREQRLVREGIVDPQTAVQAGKVLGVQYLLDVKATQFGVKDHSVGAGLLLGPLAGFQVRTSTASVALDARLLDAQTGAVLMADSGTGKTSNVGGTLAGGVVRGWPIMLGGVDISSREWSQSMLGRAARQAVDHLVKKLSPIMVSGEGTVLAALPDGTAIVSLGGFDNLKLGDRLELFRLNSIRDKKGMVVWNDRQDLGQLKVVDIRGDRARAVPMSAGAAAQEGDLVRSAKRR